MVRENNARVCSEAILTERQFSIDTDGARGMLSCLVILDDTHTIDYYLGHSDRCCSIVCLMVLSVFSLAHGSHSVWIMRIWTCECHAYGSVTFIFLLI